MTSGGPARVLLVDDSPTVRAVLRRMLTRSPELEVVGEAADGAEGVRLACDLRPDVVVMDLDMPGMNGFVATETIMREAPTAVIVLSSRARVGERRTIFEAIQRGALEVLAKPESPDAWGSLSRTFPDLLCGLTRREAGSAGSLMTVESPELDVEAEGAKLPLRYLLIGASTGGPQALLELFRDLGPRVPLTVLVVQHIAPEFESGLVDWLREAAGGDIRLARHGERPGTGAIRFAPQGSHLCLDGNGVLRLDSTSPPRFGHRPAADELFLSSARSVGAAAAGVLLSGMGRDGVEGMLALRRAGAPTLVQDEASSAVFGMPRAALEAGAADLALAPNALAVRVLSLCRGEAA